MCGCLAMAAAMTGSYGSSSSTFSLAAKWRKNVIGVTPAAAAICATVVASKPCRSNRSSAHSSSRCRVRSRLITTEMLSDNILTSKGRPWCEHR